MKTIFAILTAVAYILMLFIAGLYSAEALRFGEALILMALSFGAVYGSLYIIERLEEVQR